MLDVLGRLGHGGVLLDATGEVLFVNETARHILCRELGLSAAATLKPSSIKALLRRGRSRLRLDHDAWVRIPRESKRDLVFHTIPVANDARDPHAPMPC